MAARVITNGSQSSVSVNKQAGAPQQIKAPIIHERKDQINVKPEAPRFQDMYSHDDRAKFYTGQERISLQPSNVNRVRELQEENDHLQREIISKEKDVINCSDPLAILADIEHRQTMIARNTGEILKIYRKNEERLARVKELETQNSKLTNEMTAAQSKFIATNDMQLRTRLASEFFILKSTIERNVNEINELNKN